MEYKGGLYIFVEGPDDERFFKSVFESIFIQQFEFIKYIQYAVLPKIIVEKLVNTQKHSQKNKYIFICDMDARGDSTICITTRKEKEYNKYGKIIDKDRIFVVKEEIESWYFAAISENNLNNWRIDPISNTESLTKEDFIKLQPKAFSFRTDFMIEILKNCDLDKAILYNQSLNYFFHKTQSF